MQLVVSCKILSYMDGKSKPYFLFTADMREPLREVCVKHPAGSENQSLCLFFCIIWDTGVEDWMVEVRPVSSLTYLLQSFLVGFRVVCVGSYVC